MMWINSVRETIKFIFPFTLIMKSIRCVGTDELLGIN